MAKKFLVVGLLSVAFQMACSSETNDSHTRGVKSDVGRVVVANMVGETKLGGLPGHFYLDESLALCFGQVYITEKRLTNFAIWTGTVDPKYSRDHSPYHCMEEELIPLERIILVNFEAGKLMLDDGDLNLKNDTAIGTISSDRNDPSNGWPLFDFSLCSGEFDKACDVFIGSGRLTVSLK